MKAIGTIESLPDWQKRLIEERDELARKRTKLNIFLESGSLVYDLDLLKIQFWSMTTYLTVLNARIANLPKEEPSSPSTPAQTRRLSEHGLTMQDLSK